VAATSFKLLKRQRLPKAAGVNSIERPESGETSDSHHVRGVQPLFSGANLELDLLPL
jgi:hypothetical protein